MSTIWRPSYTAKDGTKKRCRVWRIEYTDEHGRRRQVAGFRDKQATRTYAEKLENDARRAKAGLPVVTPDHLQQPISQAIEAYLDAIPFVKR